MIREDGSSTIKPILNGDQQPLGVFDEFSKIRIIQCDAAYCGKSAVEIRMKDAAFGFVIDADTVGPLHDCLSRMLDILAMPATN